MVTLLDRTCISSDKCPRILNNLRCPHRQTSLNVWLHNHQSRYSSHKSDSSRVKQVKERERMEQFFFPFLPTRRSSKMKYVDVWRKFLFNRHSVYLWFSRIWKRNPSIIFCFQIRRSISINFEVFTRIMKSFFYDLEIVAYIGY